MVKCYLLLSNGMRFLFGWFYVRNWHSGEHELSRPRVALAAAALFLLLFALLLITILQSPIEYESVAEPLPESRTL